MATMKLGWLAGLLAMGTACGGNACPSVLLCSDRLTIELKLPDDGLEVGSYRVLITQDPQNRWECLFEVDSPGSLTWESCHGSIERGRLVWSIAAVPETVTVEATRDAQPLLTQSITPAYEDVEKGSPGCEQSCRIATIEMALP